ncbi:MAG: DEAD/DEAH box helicase [Paraprevotella sp.]|nr:DEAD/DEAH box helicase [Paraprevotella sp.]
MALATLSLCEDIFPVLVVAPLRVANMVWASECGEWAQFRGLKVAQITGTARHREEALRSKADIYTINYENLVWLHTKVGDRWPFRTVIADESTRLKNHRVQFSRHHKTGSRYMMVRGARNAGALVRHAHETKFWFNLTGTPSANGLTDLWGQQWPVDFGEALGHSFSAFRDRWFRLRFGSSEAHQILEPMPHAMEDITKRLSKTTAVVDAYDYFDITKPMELDVKFTLPEKVKKQYDKLHKESILDLGQLTTVSAVNAGSTIMKCRQMASGCIRDDDGNWHTVHTEKLKVCDEVIESTGGENVVIAYWFQHDLKALQEHYKQAVALTAGPQQRKIVDDWNAGKIPILLIHAQSAGHGLSLQHGGRHLIIYTQDWNAEYYAQVIERLGPIRQAQSGYKRMVYIHRLIAKGTWEEAVAERQQGKLSLDAAIRKAVSMCK